MYTAYCLALLGLLWHSRAFKMVVGDWISTIDHRVVFVMYHNSAHFAAMIAEVFDWPIWLFPKLNRGGLSSLTPLQTFCIILPQAFHCLPNLTTAFLISCGMLRFGPADWGSWCRKRQGKSCQPGLVLFPQKTYTDSGFDLLEIALVVQLASQLLEKVWQSER